VAEWFKAAVLKTASREHRQAAEVRQTRTNLRRSKRVRHPFAQNKRTRIIAQGWHERGFIYFLRCGLKGPYKIGFAADPEARAAVHQVSNAQELTLLGAYPGTIHDERALHRRFAEQRIRGEWFRGSPALQREIASARDAWLEHRRQRNLDQAAELLELMAARRNAA
jgi:hypothetical protein